MSTTPEVTLEEYTAAKAIIECWKTANSALINTAPLTALARIPAMLLLDTALSEIHGACAKQLFTAARLIKEYEDAHPN